MAKPAEDETAREAWALLAGLVYPPHFLDVSRRLGLSPLALGAIRFLDEPRTMSAIAGLLHCDPSNVTGIVDGLEEKGLATRLPAEHDRRVKLIALSAEGRRLRGRVDRELRKPPAWLEGLSAADQRTLRDLLRRAAGVPA
ncbi:MAG: MarR family transcriptional regulator [Solirubrobacterales bacterium]|nr:MarR family transcriptional regulator [Solirubrobacterales bacterium]